MYAFQTFVDGRDVRQYSNTDFVVWNKSSFFSHRTICPCISNFWQDMHKIGQDLVTGCWVARDVLLQQKMKRHDTNKKTTQNDTRYSNNNNKQQLKSQLNYFLGHGGLFKFFFSCQEQYFLFSQDSNTRVFFSASWSGCFLEIQKEDVIELCFRIPCVHLPAKHTILSSNQCKLLSMGMI